MSMPNLTLPSVVASAAPRTQAQSGARHAEQGDARGFEKALEASRGSRTQAANEGTDTANADQANGASSRKAARDDERKGSSLTPAEVMAMLAPFQQQTAQVRSEASAVAGAGAVDARGTRSTMAHAGTDLPALATQTNAAAASADATSPAQAGDTTGRPAKTEPADNAGQALHADTRATDDPVTLADAAVALAAAKAVPGVVADAAPATARATAKTRVGDAASATASATSAVDTDAPAAASGAGQGADVEFQAALAAATTDATGAESGNADTGDGDASPAPSPLPFQAGVASTSTTTGAAASAAAATTATVAPEVGHEAWAAALAQQVLRMSTSGQHVARLNLNPAELGPLQVTLSMNDQQTQAMFMSSHEGVRKALEAALPQLRSTLAAQGIELGQASVNSGASQQFGGQGGSFAGQDSPHPRVQVDYPGATQRADAPTTQPVAAAQRGRAQTGLDTFA